MLLSDPSVVGFPSPTRGASLVLSFKLHHHTTLILGSSVLAATRAFAALEADSEVIVLAKGGAELACQEIQWRAAQSQIKLIDWDTLPGSSSPASIKNNVETLDSFLRNSSDISLACVTETVIGGQRHNYSYGEQIYRVFRKHKIPVNITDMPDFCDYSFTSTHRFEDPETGTRTPLQIGVTTNGHGCRLAGRLRREIVAKLPKDVGVAVQKVGKMRAQVKASAEALKEHEEGIADEDIAVDELGEENAVATPNRPVPSRNHSETEVENTRRRMKWVAQVSEYWPISKLSRMSEEEMEEVLAGENINPAKTASQETTSPEKSLHNLTVARTGRILLVGSGPGNPALLTLATHTALTKLADLVLADKLVPDAVLAIIPKNVKVRIAKKFPGNAEGAQMEMMEAAVEAANRGLTVVRLKQGDPVVYGRAGEEVLYFRLHGYESLVIPGVSSALAAPIFAGIPVTQRGVAESLIICTGVGRKGKDVQLPGYERSRTLVILMGVARLEQVVSTLLMTDAQHDISSTSKRDGAAYPSHLPIAIIERASMPDQRVVASTLRDVVRALANSGEQRPPGMIVIGWAVLALWGKGDVDVLDEKTDNGDEQRVMRWLGGEGWRVREGLDGGWEWV